MDRWSTRHRPWDGCFIGHTARLLTIVMLLALSALPASAKDKSGVLKASDLLGMKVQGLDSASLGTIKDLVIDPEQGGVDYAVLDFGGFAGIGDKYFAVPWEAFELDQSGQYLLLDVSKKDLKNAPGFDKNNWPDLSQQEVVIYQFYDVPVRKHEPRVRLNR